MNSDDRNTNACSFFFPDFYLYLLIGCFGGSFAFMFIVILLLWFAFKRAKNKSKSISKQPNADTPTQGSVQFPIQPAFTKTLRTSVCTP